LSSTGSVVGGYDHMPFGFPMRISTVSGGDSRFMFGAKERDSEGGLYYYYFDARFYIPRLGRFQSPDPLGEGWNPYSYVKNNPLRYVDPSGMRTEEPPEGWYLPTGFDGWAFGIALYEPGRMPFMDASNSRLDWGETYQDRWDQEWAESLANELIAGTHEGGFIIPHQLSGLEEDIAVDYIGDIGLSILVQILKSLRSMDVVPTELAGVFEVLTEMKPKIFGLSENDARKLGAEGVWGWSRTNGTWAMGIDFRPGASRYQLDIAETMFHECFHLWDMGRRWHSDEYGWPSIATIPPHGSPGWTDSISVWGRTNQYFDLWRPNNPWGY